MTARPTNVGIRSVADSAESREVAVSPAEAAGPTVAVRPTNVDIRSVADSAESREVAVSPAEAAGPAVTVQYADVDGHPIGDSAGSREVADAITDTAGPAVAAWPTNMEICPVADSAESPRAVFETRSLLDRLLDEADALHAAEAVRADEFAAPANSHELSSSNARASLNSTAERTPSALRQRVDATKRAFSRADALVSLAQRYLRGDRPERSPIEITLTIPASSLRGGPADPVEVGQLGDSFVSGEAARRLSCDAGIVEIVEDEQGAPLSVGRKRRTIAGALKRALRKRDATCRYPGCENRLFLEGHHIKHWADGGDTSLDNALLLCSFHHHYVHEYGYTIEQGSDHRPRFRDAQGRLVPDVPARPEVADLGWPQISAMNAPLGIDASTLACGWDGTPADHGAMVGHLLAVDQPPRSPSGPRP